MLRHFLQQQQQRAPLLQGTAAAAAAAATADPAGPPALDPLRLQRLAGIDISHTALGRASKVLDRLSAEDSGSGAGPHQVAQVGAGGGGVNWFSR